MPASQGMLASESLAGDLTTVLVWSEILAETDRRVPLPAKSRVSHTCIAPRRGPIPYLRERALVLGARPEADEQEDYGLPQPLAMDRTFIWVAELVPKSKLVILLLLLYILYRLVPSTYPLLQVQFYQHLGALRDN